MKVFLRFESEAEMHSVLRLAGLISDDPITGQPEMAEGCVALPHPLRRPTGESVFNEETGCEDPVYEELPGVHVNVLTDDDQLAVSLNAWRVDPNFPVVGWAGVP